MNKYWLCDSSCEPLDMDSFHIATASDDYGWTYDSPEDLLADLQRKIEELKWQLQQSSSLQAQ